MSEYAGVPLAVGTITGSRMWSIDNMGRLVGSYGQIWRPGENVARCPKDCSGVEETCTCGFYAMHTDENLKGEAYGVIEGYGVVVVGTRGFRCTKARVVGLKVHSYQRAIIERNYPGIPLVNKRKELRSLLKGEGLPTPESLGEDFWTTGARPLQAPDTMQFYAGGGAFTWPVRFTTGLPPSYTFSSGGPVLGSGNVDYKVSLTTGSPVADGDDDSHEGGDE